MELTLEILMEWTRRVWKPCVEIALFWYAFYVLLKFLRDAGALQALKGILLVFVFFLVVQLMGLDTIARLIAQLLPISVIALLVLFQNELRRGLTRIGSSPVFKVFIREEHQVDELVKAVSAFAQKKIGAIIAIEREVSLKQHAESGVALDSILSFELLSAVFMPGAPLHDGGVVVSNRRMAAAGCLFPLSQHPRISKNLGTRHRAALGLSEETDAFVIVVSEENGIVSIAEKGEIIRDVDSSKLRQMLTRVYLPPKHSKTSGWLISMLGDKKHATAS